MRVISLLAATALAASGIHAAGAAQAPLDINGWYPCSYSAGGFDANPTNVTMDFECAMVGVPLCHEGICKSEKKIELFVRRLVATKKPAMRKALWMLQGGPGGSSSGMEHSMKQIYALLNKEVDMYTVDHRGTGRSNFLECKAAQAFAGGSPAGVNPDFTEMPNCIKDIMHQIENKTEAFSVTSAAKDVVYLTSALYASDVQTYVYGASYGTYLTERVMHLAPKHVKGYVLDGVVPEDNPSFTTTTPDQLPPAERLAAACEKDKFCSAKFAPAIKQYGSVKAAWRALYDTLDKAPRGANKCAELFRDKASKEPPSFALRKQLGAMGADLAKRLMIPAYFYRASRCNAKDVAFLSLMLTTSAPAPKDSEDPAAADELAAFDQVGGDSFFLGTLIKASEMWGVPSPSWQDELKEFTKGLLPTGMLPDYTGYCFATRAFNDPACTEVKATHPGVDFTKIDSPKFAYKPDAYWRQFAPIPAHASVLIINGKLDFQTLSDGGVREYKNLKGAVAQKMMVEFEFGGHCVGIAPSTFSDETNCGVKVIASFVAQSGETARVDTKCVTAVPALDFKDLKAFKSVVRDLKSVEDFYEANPGSGKATKHHKHHKHHGDDKHKHKHHDHTQ